jgi:hypothetical protein
MGEQQVILSKADIPKRWYNVAADIKHPLDPPLHPATNQPVTLGDMERFFPANLLEQEMSNQKWFDIPEEILDIKLYGFVTERTKASLSQRALNAGQVDAYERWPIHDLSERGAGVMLRNDDSDWLKMGKLLAMRRDPGEDWRLGVVRRITRIDADWRKIGVEFISQHPELATLEPDAPSTLSYTVDDGGLLPSSQASLALLLSYGEATLLLLESAKYGHGKTYRLRSSDGEAQHIRLDAVRDRGDGWLLTTYTVFG